MGFSFAALGAIEDFARGMGFSPAPGRDGNFTFRFDNSGTLSFTSGSDGDRVLVSLAAMPPGPVLELERHALQRAALDPTTNQFVHAGLSPDGSIVFAMSVDDTIVSMPALEACVQRLMREHTALAHYA